MDAPNPGTEASNPSEPRSLNETVDVSHTERIQTWWREHHWLYALLYLIGVAAYFVRDRWVLTGIVLAGVIALVGIVRSLSARGLAPRSYVLGLSACFIVFISLIVGTPNRTPESIRLWPNQHLHLAFLLVGGVMALLGWIIRPKAQRQSVWWVLAILPIFAINASRAYRTADIQSARGYVEAFDKARFDTASWHAFALVANSLLTHDFDVDMRRPRALIEREIRGRQNDHVLTSASWSGLLQPGDVDRIREFDDERVRLLSPESTGSSISYLTQDVWVIHLLTMTNMLDDHDRDNLAIRVRHSLEMIDVAEHGALEEAWMLVSLLDVLERPLVPESWSEHFAEMLTALHSMQAGGFSAAGGFREYERGGDYQWGSIRGTWYGVQLMKRFGVPETIDVNTVRSFLIHGTQSAGNRKYVAAVALHDLNAMPGAPRPSVMDWIRYEHTWVATLLLVLVSLVLVVSAPVRCAVSNP